MTRALVILLLFAGTAAADGPAVGPPAGGKRAPTQGPTGEIAIIGKQAYDETTLKVDTIINKLHTVYMNGVKRCYGELHKQDPNARGRMVLRFVVNAKAHTQSVATSGFNKELDQCIGNLVTGWTFGIPRDKDKNAVDASFAFDFAFD